MLRLPFLPTHPAGPDTSRIDRGIEFFVTGVQAGDDFDGTSVSSSLKQTVRAAARGQAWDGAASLPRELLYLNWRSTTSWRDRTFI